MKTYTVQVTEPAIDDMVQIGQYIAQQLRSPEAAENLLQQMENAIDGLATMPMKYALVQEERLAQQGIRKVNVGSYLLFYKIHEPTETVTVVRVLYGRREWERIL